MSDLATVRNCARCGGTHVHCIEWRRFTQPVIEDTLAHTVEWSHWATCPTTGDPILMREIPPRPKEWTHEAMKEGE